MPARHTREASPAESTARIVPSDPPGAPGPAAAPGAPRQVSERKLRANRANAARSTGPRTRAGKAASAMNALRHGLTAQTAVLAGEREGELRELAGHLRAGLGPAYGVESVLVERIVAVEWKLRRLASAEHAAAKRAERRKRWKWEQTCKQAQDFAGLVPPAPPRPGPRPAGEIVADEFFDKPEDAPLLRMAEHEARLTGSLLRAVRELHRLRHDRSAEDRPAGAEEEQEQEQVQVQVQDPQEARGAAPPSPPMSVPAPACDAPPTTIVENPTGGAPEPVVPTRAGSATGPDAAAVAAVAQDEPATPVVRDEPTAPAAQNEPTVAATAARPAAAATHAATSASARPPLAQPGSTRSAPRENEPTASRRNGPVAPPHQGPHAAAPGP